MEKFKETVKDASAPFAAIGLMVSSALGQIWRFYQNTRNRHRNFIIRSAELLGQHPREIQIEVLTEETYGWVEIRLRNWIGRGKILAFYDLSCHYLWINNLVTDRDQLAAFCEELASDGDSFVISGRSYF